MNELTESTPSRFVVGIDLGTTNSAVCYIDSSESPWRVQVFAIPQLVAPGVVESLDTLLERADYALYRAKAAGRGHIVSDPEAGAALVVNLT